MSWIPKKFLYNSCLPTFKTQNTHAILNLDIIAPHMSEMTMITPTPPPQIRLHVNVSTLEILSSFSTPLINMMQSDGHISKFHIPIFHQTLYTIEHCFG